MQEIILKAFAIVGACSLFLLVVWVIIKANNFFNNLECFRSETKYSLKWLEKDLHKLSEWKQRIVKIIAEHEDSVNLKIDEKINSQRDYFQKIFDMMNESRFDYIKHADKAINDCLKRIKNLETNEGLYKKTIDELTEREREMSKVVEQLENKPDLDSMIFEKLAKLQDEINAEIKLINIYGKQIDDLMKIKRGHANRIDDIENKLSQLVKENGELETRTEIMEAMLEEMKDRIDKLSAIEKGE